MGISAIAAMSSNGVIGKDGKLPWHIKEDLQHFKERSKDTVMIMGRKTYDSLPEVVKRRPNIVISRDPSKGVTFEWLIDNLNPDVDYLVIGGSEIYSLFEDYIDTVYLTVIKTIVKGDTYFKFNLNEFTLVECNELITNNYELSFETWYRINE